MSLDLALLPRTDLALQILRSGGTSLRDDDSGMYTWKDEQFPSVTTILNATLAKGSLSPWYASATADYVKVKADGVMALVGDYRDGKIKGSQLLDEITALCSYLQDAETVKQVPNAIRDAAGERGTYLHKVAESIVAGIPVNPGDYSEEMNPYIQGVVNYFDDKKPKVVALECASFNRALNYAGTFDWISEEDGGLWINDWKTGKNTYKDHALQLAAYRGAEFIGLKDGTEYEIPQTVGGRVILVGPAQGDRCYFVEPWPSGEREFKHFVALRELYDWVKEASLVGFRRERKKPCRSRS